ncbi:MAG: dihydrolipoyl dehydrogenase [Chloroflexi bacterium]|nr:dihydrolipoyl dehydrogenase [Chloroflexota bacterium]
MADFDLVILGGGTGGYPAAIRATQLGMKVALIERDKLGGTCLHRGCIPTKAFLESAEVLHLAGRSAEYGVTTGSPALDYGVVFQRKNRVVDQLHRGVEGLMRRNKIEVIRGEGTISGRGRITVNGEGPAREVTWDHLIIATGSRPRGLPGVEFDGQRVINSDHITMELKRVPRSLVIIGGGAVGVEFASMYRDFGAEVTLVELLPALVPLEDREVGEALQRSFVRRGITVKTGVGVKPETVQVSDAGVALEVGGEGATERLSAEALIIAVGRGGVVEGIGLEQLPGVRQERGLIQVDEVMQTGEPKVYAIGDVVGGYALAHKAWSEGVVAVEHIAGLRQRGLDYRRVPRCTYSRPQIGSMGLSEQEARQQGYSVKVGKFPFQANGRALILGESEGFAKIVADAGSGEILGVHIIGPHATELIPEAVMARYLEATPLEIGTAVHAHPTLSEALAEAALSLEGRPMHIAH